MERKEIIEKLNEIFREVLDNESIELHDSTVAGDIDEWDSLAHIQLIDAIQKSFKVKTTAREMATWQNVGEMVNGLQSKLA